MIRTTIALTIAAAALLLPAPAQAVEGWRPGHLEVKELAGYEHLYLLQDLGVEAGEIVDVTWQLCQGSFIRDCPHVAGEELPAKVELLVPSGPDGSGGTYPAYETPMLMAAWQPEEALAGHPVHGTGEREPIDGAGVVWVSQERATDADGVEWVRVGQGAADAWVPADMLTPLEPESTEEPDTDQPDEAETSADTPDGDQAATDEGARRMWLATGGAVALTAGGALMLARRRNDLEESR